MMKTTQAIITVFTLAAVISCEKPDDIKPVATIESPVNKEAFVQGSTIRFKAVFEDNAELQQYKIDIHDDIDQHGHQKTDSTVLWAESIIEDISGIKQTVTRDIGIPADARPGPYHFIVKCIDAAGNESSSEEIDITINE